MVGEFQKTNNPKVEYLPAKFISADLQIKKWSAGDRIEYQKGKHKKVSDLLTESQLSPFEKEVVYCLWHEKEIIWVIGIRLSVEGYIKSKSENYLRLEYVQDRSTTPTKEDIVSIMSAMIT
jgi:tRNA(Ile)-lysidine synthetase-like protein